MIPAMIGLDRLVPPMRYSEYLTVPSGNVWVSPIRYPVLGSAKAAISGTAPPVRPRAPNTEAGTTPLSEDGLAKIRLTPPPAPYTQRPAPARDQAPPVPPKEVQPPPAP